MGKTSVDAVRHMKALDSLFFELGEVSAEVLRNFIQHYKQKKYLRQSLKRFIDRGFIKQDRNSFWLTLEGQVFFRRRLRKYSRPVIVSWDGKWRLISFDVPGGYNRDRNRLRDLLKDFGFYLLHKSVWIYPSSLSENFWKFIVKEKLDKYCKVMIVEILEGDAELKKHFKLK